MMMTPKVFISYSHDSQEHKGWVIDLARFLVSNGVDVLIDVWAVRAGEDLPKFMEDGVTSANRVLMICTKRYVEKADGAIGGVGYEKMIVTAELIKNLGTSKFIPIIRQSEPDRKVPKFVGVRYYIDLSDGVDVDAARAHLLRDLHNVPPDRPPLGLSPFARMVPKATESVEETTDGRAQFLATLMRDLASVVILGEELEHRGVNPWLDLIRSTFGNVASILREAAADQIAINEELDASLLDAAETLDHFAKLRLHLGSGSDISRTANAAVSQAKDLLRRIGPEVTAHVSPKQILDQLAVIWRKLAILNSQANKTPRNTSMEELQAQASELGLQILHIAQYDVDRLAPDLRSALVATGHDLHVSETERVYIDGGASVARIVNNIKKAIDRFNVATQPVLAHES
jgi:hypothetical protein